MTALRLDIRVQFRRAAYSDDGLSQVKAFGDLGGPIWAAKEDIAGGEQFRASEVSAYATTRFVVRYSSFASGVTPKDQILCNGRTFEISGIRERGGRKQWLEFTCTARADK